MPAVAGHQQKPTWDVSARGIDGSNSIANGLCGYWLFGECGGLFARDRVRGRHLTLATTALWGKAKGIPGLISNASDYAEKTSITGLPNIQAVHSFSAWINYIQTGSVGSYMSYGQSGLSNNLADRVGGAFAGFGVYTGSSGETVCKTSTYPDAGIRHVVYSFDGTTRALYVDGIAQTLSSFVKQDSSSFSNLRLLENLNSSFAENPPSGSGVLSLAFWNRALRANEARALYENHVGLFTSVPDIRVSADGGAADATIANRLTLLGVGA